MRNVLICFLSLVFLFNVYLIQAEDANGKLEAYNLVSEALNKLESQLDLINESISLAEDKIKINQSKAAQGHSGPKAVVELFKEQLGNLESQKDEIDSQVKTLNKFLEDLKKDPEVGSIIVGQEANRMIKNKLDKASSLLPKIQ